MPELPLLDNSNINPNSKYAAINQAASTYDAMMRGSRDFVEPIGSIYGGKRDYDEGLPISVDTPEGVDEWRAQQQSVGNRLVKTPLRVASTAIAEVAKMPGYLGGLADWSTTGFDSSEINRMVDNAWVKGVTEAQDYINEDILTVYTPESVKNGGLLDNLSSASFWATEGADGVGFLVSFLAPGAALKAIGMGAKGAELLNLAAKGSKLGTGTSELVSGGVKFGSKAARNIDDIGAIMANTTLESAAEATDTYKTALQSYKQAGYSEEQAKQMAGKAAAGDFVTNLALLAATNTVSQMQLFGAFSNYKNEKGILGRMFDEKGNFITGLKKSTVKERLPSVGKELAKGIVSEGFLEEGMQTAAQKYWQEKQLHPEDHDTAITGILKSYWDNFSDIEMQKSIFLGGFLGSIQGGISHYRSLSEEDRQMFGSGAVKPNKLLKGLGVREREATTGMYTAVENGLINDLDIEGASSIYKRNDDNTYKVDAQGNREIDIYKFGELIQKVQNQDSVAHMMQFAKLMGRNDVFNRLYLATKTNAFLQFIREDGGIDLLNKHIDSMSKSDAAKMGDAFNVSESQIKSLLKNHAESLNRNYQAINNTHNFTFKVAKDPADMQGWYDFSNKVFNRKLDSAVAIDQAVNNLRDLTSRKVSIEGKDEKSITAIDTQMLKDIDEQIKATEAIIDKAKKDIEYNLNNEELTKEYNKLKQDKAKVESEAANVDTTPFDADAFLESKGYSREDIKEGNIEDIYFNYKHLDTEKELVAKLQPDGKYLVYDKSDLSTPLLDTTGLPIEFNRQYIESNKEKIILLSESEAEGLDDDQLADSQTLVEDPTPSDVEKVYRENFNSARRLNVKTTGGKNFEFDFSTGNYRDFIDAEGYPIPNPDANQQRWYKHLDDNPSLQDRLVVFVSYKDLERADIPEELKSLIRTTAQMVTPQQQATAIFSVLTDSRGVPIKDKNDKFLFTTIGTTESLFEGDRPLVLLDKLIKQRLGENISDSNAEAYLALFDPMVPKDAEIIWDEIKYTKQELYTKLVEEKKQEIIEDHRAWRRNILSATSNNSMVYSKPEKVSNGILVSQIDINSPSKAPIKHRLPDVGITIGKNFRDRGWSILIGDASNKTIARNGYKVPSGWAVIQQGNNILPVSAPTLNTGQVNTVVALLRHLVSGNAGLNKFIETSNGKYPVVPNIGLDNRPNKNTDALLPNLIHYGKVDKNKKTKGELFFDKETRMFLYLPENATEYSKLSIEDLNNPTSPNLLIFKDFLSRKRMNINKSLVNGEEVENPNVYLLPQIDEQGNLVMVNGKLQMTEFTSYEHYLLNYLTTSVISKNNPKGLPQFASRYLILNNEVKTSLEDTKKEESPIIKEPVVSMFIPQEVGNELQQEAEEATDISDIESKKADIERRRQEELDKETPIKNENITVDFGGGVFVKYQVITYKNGSVKISTTSQKAKRYNELSNEVFKDYAKIDFESDAKGIIKTELVKNDYTDEQSQEIKAAKEKIINAKYDAELATLETKPIEVKETVIPTQRTSLKDRIPIGTTPYSEYLQAFRESGLTTPLTELEWNSKKQHEMDKIISCLPKK